MTKIIRKSKELITDVVKAEIDEQAFNESYKVYSVEVKSPNIKSVSLQLFELGIALGVVVAKDQFALKIYFMSYADTPVLTEENRNLLKTLKKENLTNINNKPKQLQLLLNSMPSILNGAEYGNKNTGYFLEHKKQSNAVICHDLVFFNTSLGIVLVNNTKTFKKPEKNTNPKTKETDVVYPTHALQNGFVNFATKKDAVYVDKAFGGTHNINKQYTLNYREAETSFLLEYKMGVRAEEINKFNNCYKGIAYVLTNYKIPDWTTLDFGLSADAAKRKGIELLRTAFPTLNVIYSKKEPEHKDLAEKVKKVIAEELFSDKKNTYSMNNISVSDKPFKENQVATLRIIKAKEEYKDEHDLYLDVTNNKVQHITSQSLEGVSDSEFKAIILNSLASLYFQALTNFDFGEFGNLLELNNWTFYIPVWAEQLVNNRKSLVGLKTLEIKEGQLNYYIQDVADMFWLIATPSDVVERLNFDFEFAFTTPNSKWGIVFDTGFGTSLDIEAIHEEAKILKKEKEVIGDGRLNRALASVDAIDEFFPSVFNSGYTLKDGWYYYYSNKRGRGINQKNKMTTKPRLHSFRAEGISNEEMELLLKFMNHPLLRGGELSVAPVPVKMLRHHKF
jgi:hypothetical protein